MANAKQKNKEVEKSWHFTNGWKHMKAGAWEINIFEFCVEFCDSIGELMFRGCLFNFWYDFSIKICEPAPYKPVILERHRFINGYMQEDYLEKLDSHARLENKKKLADGTAVITFSKRPLKRSAGWKRVFIQWTVDKDK